MSKTKKEDVADDKMKALELAMAQLNDQFGQGTVMRLDAEPIAWPAFSTGALTLDVALGIGGLPRGRIVEIYGPESSGKSTTCLNTVASAQKEGGRALYVDVEHAVDPTYAKALGVKFEDLIFSQPDSGEEALEVLIRVISTGAIDVAVVDSVAALTPQAELDGEMGDAHVGRQARLMSMAMRKLTAVVAKTNTLVIFTNQIREKIGVMFGNPETTPGGRALPFYSSVRIELRRVNKDATKDKSTGEHTGMRVKAKIIKNKMAPPFKEAYFNIVYGEGIDELRAVIEMAETLGLVQKSGAWYAYGDTQLGQGLDNAVLFLREKPDLVEEIALQVYTQLGQNN